MGQKIWRRWCNGPRTAIFQNSGGGGGGLGDVAYKDWARLPPLGPGGLDHKYSPSVVCCRYLWCLRMTQVWELWPPAP